MAKKKKSISAWKEKRPYTILAPENFDGKELATTISSDPKKLVGRKIQISFRDLTGDRSKQHLKLTFEVSDVRGEKAYTKVKMFDTQPGYLKSKVRRGITKMDFFEDVELSGEKARVKLMVLTRGHVQKHQKDEIRKEVTRILARFNKQKAGDVIQHASFGKLGTEIYQKIKKIHPIHRVEVWQIRIL